jgi:hypothetical protein
VAHGRAEVEGVDAVGAPDRQVARHQAATGHDVHLVAALAPQAGFRGQDVQSVLDAGDAARRQYGVRARPRRDPEPWRSGGRGRRPSCPPVFLFSAATGPYGGEGEGREDFPVTPVSPYREHKLAMERLVADSGANWLTLRLSRVVGPRQNPVQLFPSLVRRVRSGTVMVHRGARRDLMDVHRLRSSRVRLRPPIPGLLGQPLRRAPGGRVRREVPHTDTVTGGKT